MDGTVDRLRWSTPGDEGFARGSVTFIGTATVLIRYAGFIVMTDPNFLHRGEHVHLGYGLRSVRLTDPAIELEALPPLDLVVLSHLHEDHFDRVVARRLNRRLPIVTTPRAAAKLRQLGFERAHGLRKWGSLTAEKRDARLRITALPGTHGPGPLARALPQVMGSLLEFGRGGEPPALRLYISGDTLIFDQLREIPRRYPDIDLALLHLGGTRIFGVMLTMDAEQGVEAIRIVRPERAIPIHYNDYEVFRSPIEDFQRAVRAAGLEDRVTFLRHGETYTFEPPASRRRAPLRERALGEERA